MATLAKLVTVKMIVWARNGKAMLAKSATTGKFIKLADAQWLLDNLAMLAVRAKTKTTHTVEATLKCIRFEKEFIKAVEFFGVKSIESNARYWNNQPEYNNAVFAFTSNS